MQPEGSQLKLALPKVPLAPQPLPHQVTFFAPQEGHSLLSPCYEDPAP